MILIFGAIDLETAGAKASLDLIFDAGARTIAKDRIRAGAQGKNLADDVDGLAQSVGRAERAKVLAAIAHDFARDHDARPRMVGHLGAQVRLIVLEPDVISRAVLLDQVVFENQRLFLATRDQYVEVADALHQKAHLEASVAVVAEVGPHARAQRLGLADVQNFPRAFAGILGAHAFAQQID